MFHLDTLSTLVAATLVLLLGRKLVQTVPLLKKYTIPEPVAGGLLVALALLVLKKSMGWELDFDMSLKDPLMLAFFATIGLNANLASLRSGGKVVGTFLIVVVGLLLTVYARSLQAIIASGTIGQTAALVVGGAAVVAFLIFVAVPVLFVAAGIGVAAWLLLRFIRG